MNNLIIDAIARALVSELISSTRELTCRNKRCKNYLTDHLGDHLIYEAVTRGGWGRFVNGVRVHAVDDKNYRMRGTRR